MRHSWISLALLLLFTLLILAAFSGGQTLPATGAQARPELQPATGSANADWSRVRDLANGDKISVSIAGRQTLHCRFAGATGDLLFCDARYAWSGDRSYQFDRNQVKEVRLDHQVRNRRVLTGIAAVAGGVFAGLRASSPVDTRAGVFEGLAGAGAFALITYPICAGVALFIPGSLIYRQPRPQNRPARSAEPAKPAPSPVPGPTIASESTRYPAFVEQESASGLFR